MRGKRLKEKTFKRKHKYNLKNQIKELKELSSRKKDIMTTRGRGEWRTKVVEK